MWYNQPVQIQILRQQSTTKMEDIYACELFWKADSFQSIDLFMGDQQTKACSSYWIGKPQFITIPGCRTLYCFRLVAWDQFARLPAHRQIGFPIHQQEFLDTSRSDRQVPKSHCREEFEFWTHIQKFHKNKKLTSQRKNAGTPISRPRNQ